MTTPERLRRRQRVETALVIIVIMLSSLSTAYVLHRVNGTQDCLQSKFRDLSVTLSERGDINDRESVQNRDNWLILAEAAGYLRHDPTIPQKKNEQLQRELVTQLLHYRRVIRTLEHERATNPFPPYPAGACTSD